VNDDDDFDDDDHPYGSCDDCDGELFASAVHIVGALQFCDQCAWKRSQASALEPRAAIAPKEDG
jgi:hypothetical protein